jgi:hypothetical protein
MNARRECSEEAARPRLRRDFFRRHHAPPRRGRFAALLLAQKLLIAPPVAIQPVDDVSRRWKYWLAVVDTLLRLQ